MKPGALRVVTSINGRLVRRGQDKISVLDNSLLYAEGLFETFLAVDDRLIFAENHLQRLYKGAKVIGLKIPVSPRTIESWMRLTLEAHPARIKKLRLTVTSGESARWTGIQGKPQVILNASPHEIPTRPFKLHVSEFRVDEKSVFRRIKTLSYAIHAAALKLAKTRKCDDALMLNESNNISEVTSANIFWVKQGKIYTPPLESGCLDGVTRKRVIIEAEELHFDISEKNCRLDTLLKADEVFISSSLKLVIGVSQIKIGQKIHRLTAGPVTDSLSRRFRLIASVD